MAVRENVPSPVPTPPEPTPEPGPTTEPEPVPTPTPTPGPTIAPRPEMDPDPVPPPDPDPVPLPEPDPDPVPPPEPDPDPDPVPPPEPTPPSDLSTPEGRATHIAQFFAGQGYSAACIQAILANFAAETAGSYDPSSQRGTSYFGVAQWGGGRDDNLKSYAASLGKPWNDLDVQLNFVMEEMNPNSPYYDNTLKDHCTPTNLNNAMATVEAYYGPTGDLTFGDVTVPFNEASAACYLWMRFMERCSGTYHDYMHAGDYQNGSGRMINSQL